MRNTERRPQQDNGVLANGNDTNTHHNHGDEVSGRRRLINELRGFAEGSTSARASLMRDAADALEAIDSQIIPVYDGETQLVRWHSCKCEWASKYCDENHTARALVPVMVLNIYRQRDDR